MDQTGDYTTVRDMAGLAGRQATCYDLSGLGVSREALQAALDAIYWQVEVPRGDWNLNTSAHQVSAQQQVAASPV